VIAHPEIVVADSSSLIALNQIGRLDILRQLYPNVLVPPAVAREITRSVVRPNWISRQPLAQPIDSDILSAKLGPGETEAISLARELNALWVVLDDRPARHCAARLSLPVIGTVGVLRAAKLHGLLPVLRPDFEELLRLGFHLSLTVAEEILAGVGEGK
jgi:predicted nucleic acid-binding protein